ncbi:MAG TPA: hypothetical protein VK142_09495, partial [Bacillota bacterium]|nr:hypothetical protein [Bacillota bacterium]
IKKGVQGTSIVGGAVVGGTVGAAAGGVGAIPGALSGASMGSSVGKASTGDGSPGDVARSAGHTAMAMKGKPDMKQSSSQTDLQSKTHPKQGKQASGDQQGQTGKQAGQAGQEKANNNQGNQNEQNNYQENEQSNRESQNQEEPPIQHGYQLESEGAYPAISLQQPYEEQPSGVQQENGQDHEMSQVYSSNSGVQPYNNDVSHGDQEPYYLKPDTRSTNDHMAKENNERRLGKNPSQPNRERGAAQVDQEHSESAATLKPSNESSYDHYRKTEQWNEGNQLNQSETVEENNTVKSNPVSSKKSSDQIRNNRRTNYPDKTTLDTGVDKPNTPTLDRSYTEDSNRKGDHLQ